VKFQIREAISKIEIASRKYRVFLKTDANTNFLFPT
jgi:hypothetical protein